MLGTTATGWLLHTLAGGGLVLLLAWAWAACTRQPARRLRVAEWAVAASLVLAILSLGPAWLVVATPAPAQRLAPSSLISASDGQGKVLEAPIPPAADVPAPATS